MIAGIETSDLTILLLPTYIDFTGKGRGTYGDVNGGYDTVFDVVTNVDFGRLEQ